MGIVYYDMSELHIAQLILVTYILRNIRLHLRSLIVCNGVGAVCLLMAGTVVTLLLLAPEVI